MVFKARDKAYRFQWHQKSRMSQQKKLITIVFISILKVKSLSCDTT